jgi:hypothetical protein
VFPGYIVEFDTAIRGMKIYFGITFAMGAAPLTRMLPFCKFSVMIGLAAGRYLNSAEYLESQDTT